MDNRISRKKITHRMNVQMSYNNELIINNPTVDFFLMISLIFNRNKNYKGALETSLLVVIGIRRFY